MLYTIQKEAGRDIDQSSLTLSALKNNVIPMLSAQRMDQILNKEANALTQYAANDTDSNIANVPKSVTPLATDKITQMNSNTKQRNAVHSFNTGKNVDTPPAPPVQ